MAAITVIGTGYVGLATAVCLAELGHRVTGLDIDAEKIGKLRQGTSPIYEPGLVDLLGRGMAAGRLSFTTDYGEAVPGAEFVFIAVAPPMGRRGDADIVFVKQAAQSIAQAMRGPLTIVNKSTVPIGTGDIVSRIVHENLATEIPFQVICNPEFLREGTAIQDFMHPDRVVLGSNDRAAAEAVAAVYERLDAPILFTNLYTAEMIKYASNAFLATRISFINEIARICERVDADVKVVAEGMGLRGILLSERRQSAGPDGGDDGLPSGTARYGDGDQRGPAQAGGRQAAGGARQCARPNHRGAGARLQAEHRRYPGSSGH